MTTLFSKKIDELSVSKGLKNPIEYSVEMISELSAGFFLFLLFREDQKREKITLEEYESLPVQQQFILKKAFFIKEEDAPQTIYLPVGIDLLKDSLTRAFFIQINNSFHPNQIKQFCSEERNYQNIEMIKELHYYSFFASIAMDTKENINRFLPHSIHPKKESTALFFGYDHPGIPKNHTEELSYFLFLDRISFTIYIVIRDADQLYHTISFLTHFYKKGFGHLETHLSYVIRKLIFPNINTHITRWLSIYPFFSIKIIGNGFGAMVGAFLLEFLLGEKEFSDVSVKAVLFNSPPVFSLEKCERLDSSIVSVVFGWNPLSSFSIENIYRTNCGIEFFDLVGKDTVHYSVFIPGAVYWLTYGENGNAEAIYPIEKTNNRLRYLVLDSQITRDSHIYTTYAYLLGLYQKTNENLE